VTRPGNLLAVQRWASRVRPGVGKLIELALGDVFELVLGKLIEFGVYVTANAVEGGTHRLQPLDVSLI